jgi:hypothetical protein
MRVLYNGIHQLSGGRSGVETAGTTARRRRRQQNRGDDDEIHRQQERQT